MKKNKIISIVLAVVMCLATITPLFAETAEYVDFVSEDVDMIASEEQFFEENRNDIKNEITFETNDVLQTSEQVEEDESSNTNIDLMFEGGV